MHKKLSLNISICKSI